MILGFFSHFVLFLLEMEGEELCGDFQGGIEDQTSIIITNNFFYVDQRFKIICQISQIDFTSSVHRYVLKYPHVMIFSIHLGICLLASLPTNVFLLVIFYDFHVHEPMQWFSPYLDMIDFCFVTFLCILLLIANIVI